MPTNYEKRELEHKRLAACLSCYMPDDIPENEEARETIAYIFDLLTNGYFVDIMAQIDDMKAWKEIDKHIDDYLAGLEPNF